MLDKKSEQFYQKLYEEEILPCLKEEGESDGLTSDQLDGIACQLEADIYET